MPSGVDASTGEVAGVAVRADVTVTFGALKIGLVVSPGAEFAGRVEVVDIGLSLPRPEVTLLDADDVAELVPEPHGESDKYRRGVVGIVAGSDTYTGAAQLSVGGALATGVGMVRYVGGAHPAELVRQRWPEAVVTEVHRGDGAAVLDAGRVQAWVVGSGLGTDSQAGGIVEAILSADVPVLVDADAITWLASHRELLAGRQAPTLLTPHAGEFARLMDVDRADVEAHRLDHARRAANALGVTVLLKGSTTVIASPADGVRVNTASTAYLATAGSGDVLSGVCGALLAGGLGALDADRRVPSCTDSRRCSRAALPQRRSPRWTSPRHFPPRFAPYAPEDLSARAYALSMRSINSRRRSSSCAMSASCCSAPSIAAVLSDVSSRSRRASSATCCMSAICASRD